MQNFKKHIGYLALIVLLILVGYYKLFLGANLLFHEDWVAVANHTHGNELGNGWRPEKGFGISNYYADPGMWHPWGLLSLLERICPSREFAHSLSVVLLDVIAAWTMYFFILFIFRELRKSGQGAQAGINQSREQVVAALASLLIIFCSDQSAYHFFRALITSIIGMPLIIMILHNHYQSPKKLDYFWIILLFWFVPFLGTLAGLTSVMQLGVFFTLMYAVYYKQSLRKLFLRLLGLYSVAGVALLFLGAWCFYSFFLEKMLVGYVREKPVEWPNPIQLMPSLKGIGECVVGLIFPDWLPLNHYIVGVWYKPFARCFNVQGVFPLVFLFFIFKKSEHFWEYTLKWLIGLFLIYSFIMHANLIPGFKQIFSFLISKTSTLINFYDLIFVLQVPLLVLFVRRLKQGDFMIRNIWGRRLQMTVAVILLIFFAGLVLLNCSALFFPQWLPQIAGHAAEYLLPQTIKDYPKELVKAIIVFNVQRFQDVMTWTSLIYYILTAVLVAPFLRDRWLSRVSRLSPVLVTGLLMANAILLSWSIYPLNQQKSPWAKIHFEDLKPTDRFYYVFTERWGKTMEAFQNEIVNIQGKGPRERLVGLHDVPALNFSGFKSFDTKRNREFFEHIFAQDDRSRSTRLYYGGLLLTSPLIDMSAVSYYYSTFPLKDLPVHLTLYKKTKQLYVYKNLSAWPYYYLAEKLELKKEDRHLSDVRPGTAYLEQKDWFDLPSHSQRGKVDLKAFTYGTMVFDYDSPANEFLVVADSWHPFWKARLETGESLPVIRANEVFKGIQLPAGRHQVTMHFDTSLYKPGIYISIVSWILFFIGFVWAQRTNCVLKV